jgi:hypothetical protein
VSGSKAKALVKSLRDAELVDHAAKDLLRAAHLPLLPSDESHVDADLKRIHKGKPLVPVCSFAATLQADLSLWRTAITGFALSAISTRARQSPAELPTSLVSAHSTTKSRVWLAGLLTARVRPASKHNGRRGDSAAVPLICAAF